MRTWTDGAAEAAVGMGDERDGEARTALGWHRWTRVAGVVLVLLGVLGRVLLGSWTVLVVLVALGAFTFFLVELQAARSHR